MKQVCLLIAFTVTWASCVSVKKYNGRIGDLRSEKHLRADVDYIYKKLQKLHPNLYGYISKKELDYKFDSLKSSIQAPMASNDFFMKLSPVISSIRQGHINVVPLMKMKEKKERLPLDVKEVPLLAQFDYEIHNNKLYMVKTSPDFPNIKPGTEVVSVNNIKPWELVSKYRNTFSSDGYNETYIAKGLCKRFPSYFHFENGYPDSLLCELKYNDTIRAVCLKNKINPPPSKAKDAAKQKKQVSAIKNMELSFINADSTIALMKIKVFSDFGFAFYRNSFKTMQAAGTKTLILDLRDNPGGLIRSAYNLYAYLADTNFYFIDKSEVASRTSLLHTNSFRNSSIVGKVFFVAFTPLRLVFMGASILKVEKGANNKYYYALPISRQGRPKPYPFKGKVYVLVNGGTFSASCFLASNLKGSKRATFVGEETGGAYNGSVAGILPVYKLPKSKLQVSFGLAYIQPYHKTDTLGRGIFPDVEIKPTPQDRIQGIDPEIKWVTDDINGQHNVVSGQ